MSRFQVLFSGELAEGASEATVRQNLMRRLGLDERKVAQLFSGRTVVVRSDLTREAADELQAELAGLGAIARIKNSTPDEKAKFKIDRHRDQTMKDITAAHIECPRCGHLQLETEFCARCGIDIATAAKQKRKEDILIEKRIRGLKTQKPGSAGSGTAEDVDISERLEPIKRRSSQRPAPHPRASQPRHTPSLRPSQNGRAPQPQTPSTATKPTGNGNPFGNPFGGSFWRNVLKFGRKDERP
jgi:ribosomal protein L37E